VRILLVEDDEILANVLTESLQQQRYIVDAVGDGRVGLEYAESGSYDLLLLDVGLPRLDGISLCQQLRSESASVPILLMTAQDAPDEKIRGLDAGADDYLTKPFSLAELHARLRALLRRQAVSPTSVLEVGQLRLNPVSCEVTYAAQLLKLTPKEYSLMELFLRNPTRVFSRGHIIEHLWTFDDPPLEDSVKAHVKGLRRRLKDAGADGWIENVYGLGYRLSPKVEKLDTSAVQTANLENTQINRANEQRETLPAHESLPTADDSIEQQFNRSIAALWQQHRGAMAERLRALQIADRALQQNQLSETQRQAAAQAAHKLAGVLGMFGKDQGTAIARSLEVTLSPENLSLPSLDSANSASVTTLVQQMANILDLAEVPASLAQPSAPAPSSATQSQAIRILAVDDDPVFLSSLPPMLSPWGMAVTPLLDPGQFWQVLKATLPDLLILDIEMPGCDGIELCQAVRNDAQWQSLPVLFLTARPDAAAQVFAAGADDYVVKPVLGPELITRITNRLERSQLLQKLRGRDLLTGLVNQVQAQREFQQLSSQRYTLALLRLVNLAEINLTYGHPSGQQVLKAWGADLSAQLPDALLSYWGNGDFVIGLPSELSAATDGLAAVLKGFRQRVFTEVLAAGSSPDRAPSRFQAQYAVGLATFPDDGKTLADLYRAAHSTANRP
jgi:DNA-binding response OmpR family regulator/HPt (histidine-containing phosphotransfer) domain-containing protein